MVAIAIFSVDPVLRGNLEQLPREDPAITIVGIVDSPLALLELAETHHVDVVLAETLPSELLTDQQVRHQQTAWVLILDRADEETSLDALSTGASAILPRTANRREIVTAIRAVTKVRRSASMVFSVKMEGSWGKRILTASRRPAQV